MAESARLLHHSAYVKTYTEREMPAREITFWAIFAATLIALAWWYISPANAHDHKDPELDQWVGSLMRPHSQSGYSGGTSCCSLDDCHKTEAQRRGDGEWWARIGWFTEAPDGAKDWHLADWVKVPKETIVTGPNGNPIPNKAGEALICHPIVWKTSAHDEHGLDAEHTQVYCFVPPFETRLRRLHVSQRRSPWAQASAVP